MPTVFSSCADREGDDLSQKASPLNLTLGFFSFIPIVYVVGYILVFVSFVLKAPTVPKHVITEMLIAHLCILVLMGGLSLFYGWVIVKSGKIPKSQRVSWFALLFVGNVLSFPLFWYILFWKGMIIKGDTAPAKTD